MGGGSEEPIVLKHDVISMAPYSGRPFRHQEMVSSNERIRSVKFYAHAMGVEFYWTLNQEMLFSFALTARPSRKEVFGEYRRKSCVIGIREDYVEATAYREWIATLEHSNLWELKNARDDALILSPANNTDYANVSACLEAFWGYLWPQLQSLKG